MFNLKLSIYGALFGLIISIFFGLVGGIQFGVILLRALISALLCGGILALASFLFKRFLSDSLSDLSSDSYTPVPGGIVDITVDEDVLPDSDNAPDFYISKKYGENQSVQTNESKSIEKVGSVETFHKEKSNDVFESEEKVSENDTHQFVQTPLAKEKYVSSDGSESGLESLDSLPEFGTVIPTKSSQESEVIEDSAFARGETSTQDLISDADVGADTNLMAEAIKTLLRREG